MRHILVSYSFWESATITSDICFSFAVKRLPQADLILALNAAGQIIQQGSFSELNVAGTYIHSLQVNLGRESDDRDKDEGSFETELKHPASSKSDDLSRKTGDMTIYKYYARALGPLALIFFVSIIAVYEVFNALGSKLG